MEILKYLNCFLVEIIDQTQLTTGKMEKLLSLGVYAVKIYCMFCSSQSCNALSNLDNETFHPGLVLDPDTECKKILQLCKKIQCKSSRESNNMV